MLRIARHEVVIIARVVEAILLGRDTPQPQPGQIADPEEVTAAEERRLAWRSPGVRDLAEQIFTALQLAPFDLEQARQIRGLRPEARPLADLGVLRQRLVAAPALLVS